MRDAFKAVNPSLDTLAIALMQTAQNLGALPENRVDENRVDENRADSGINDTQSDCLLYTSDAADE